MERKIGRGGDSSSPLGLPRTVQSAQPLRQDCLPPYSGGTQATTSNLTDHLQCPATCLYILILVLLSSTVKPVDRELRYYLLTSCQPDLSGFQCSQKEVRLKGIETLIVKPVLPQSRCRMKAHVGLWSRSFKGVSLRPSSGYKEANA